MEAYRIEVTFENLTEKQYEDLMKLTQSMITSVNQVGVVANINNSGKYTLTVDLEQSSLHICNDCPISNDCSEIDSEKTTCFKRQKQPAMDQVREAFQPIQLGQTNMVKQPARMLTVKGIIENIEANIEKPMVTAKFGDMWRSYAIDTIPYVDLVTIAWKEGRKAILLERALEQFINTDNQGVEMPSEEEWEDFRQRFENKYQESFGTTELQEIKDFLKSRINKQ